MVGEVIDLVFTAGTLLSAIVSYLSVFVESNKGLLKQGAYCWSGSEECGSDSTPKDSTHTVISNIHDRR